MWILVDPVVGVIQKAPDPLLVQLLVHIAQGGRDDAVEQCSLGRGLEKERGAFGRLGLPRVLDDHGLPVLPPVLTAALRAHAPCSFGLLQRVKEYSKKVRMLFI